MGTTAHEKEAGLVWDSDQTHQGLTVSFWFLATTNHKGVPSKKSTIQNRGIPVQNVALPEPALALFFLKAAEPVHRDGGLGLPQ